MTTAGSIKLATRATSARNDFGDFQTPRPLVDAILARLGADGERFARVFEPTCGRGHFLAGMLAGPCPPAELRGVEIQPEHAEAARSVVGDPGPDPHAPTCSSSTCAATSAGPGAGALLVVGNPPWVTVAALGASGGSARNPGPARINARGVRGLDA